MKNIKKIAAEILRQASYLTGEQQQKIEQALSSGLNVMSFQEMAQQLAPQIGANEQDIYSWLVEHYNEVGFTGRIQ